MASSEYVKQIVDPALMLDGKILEDNSIQERNFVSYPPTSQTALEANSGDIRLHINQTDQFTGLYDSWLRVQLKVAQAGGTNYLKADQVALIHNAFFHLFATMRLEMNGQEIQRLEDCGIVNTLVRNILATVDDDHYGLDSGFKLDTSYRKTGGVAVSNGTTTNGTEYPIEKQGPSSALDIGADLKAGHTTQVSEGFAERRQLFSRYATAGDRGRITLKIPLKEIFTFARDYVKYLYGFSYTLVLTRADVITASRRAVQTSVGLNKNDPIVSITKMEWVVPHVRPSLEIQDKLYRQILDKKEYPIAFRQQRTAKFQGTNAASFTWNANSVNVSSEKPLYALIAFTRDRDNDGASNATAKEVVENNHALFEDPQMIDIAIYANGVRIPQESRSDDSHTLNFADCYADFQEFKHKFLGLPAGVRSPISVFDFQLYNMCYVFDITRLPEQFRSGTVNITVKANAKNSFTSDLTAHMVLWTKQVMIAKSDGSRQTIIKQ